MKKIPTMFERDWTGDKSRVVNQMHKDCQWVADGEGVATRKIDGTSCMVRSGRLFKRRELRDADVIPEGFEPATKDEEIGKTVGWIPVGDEPEAKWHRVAFAAYPEAPDGTYELVGPKIQGNHERFTEHALVDHSDTGEYEDCPRTFDDLRIWLSGRDIEGIVFHHPDGRMAKIKLRDFGLRREAREK